ncbi:MULTISPECIES: PilZ domain-containing protein [Rhodopseudomonas]|uniref:Pilus assembly protein PilZ n=1 Tax=Rhodopseudomonas palustris TaxID=1076 RepID=A0A0D7E6H6_RHOPL|nr:MULTISPECIES: PilZ domain-containing protein [Rhodopseudomonas]KIZ36464.1 pilus assembly protein PilZ [Rhodopseudomonas palustris]MDF3809497.1 PilZ domain-containing protein [Rhodopseudomonas sp. BAL398]WOK19363.1 PilZ domain-containing protein [Rhodopseudomonas sp. BAL398]
MLDRRQIFRGRVYYGGRIAFNARKSTLDCIVRNFSPAGARVELSASAMLPDEVDFTIPCKGQAFLARMIWRRQDDAGFEFRYPRRLHGTVPLDWTLRLRASEHARRSLQQRLDRLSSEL